MKIILHLGAPITFEEYYGKLVDNATRFKLAARVRGKVAELISLYRQCVTREHPFGKKVKKNVQTWCFDKKIGGSEALIKVRDAKETS